ncbi:putative bifunctional diguanylate cyclase/phosphodiesterase [Parvibium lacunae]|uniref:GGDEF domain-containing protein n=1 Tax=Parvibium lacunae TaxID=1888893 RepID=A0A368L1T0_9BURK|nr:GGDEF domain-containing phosphodiesterase [Parvibium lacunae]RCS57524.1 GGDEF domain-containing protein [Parvibium lacunae]
MRFFNPGLATTRPSDFLHACEFHLEKLEHQHEQQPDAAQKLAVLWINLGRDDRIAALANQGDSQKLNGEILHRLTQALRHEDRVCLADPNQVWILLPQLPNLAFAELAATKIRQTLETPFMIENRVWQLHLTIGIAASPDHETDPLGLLNAAEQAAKVATRQQEGYTIAAFHQRNHPQTLRALQNELRWALTDNSLEVYYQPQIDLRTGACVSAEALIRWQRKPGEWVAADQIAAMAEASGMMYNLTMFVLHTVGRQHSELQAQGCKLKYAINLSASMLDDPNLAAAISDALDIWGIPPDHIVIEVTESSIINDVERAIKRFSELRALGMQLSIDDFGTGYSSLAYLRRFPLNELKIDQVFVRGMLDNPGDARIVKSVITLAHTFDLLVVAEGVENAEIAQQLQALGCDITQGYHYSPPLNFSQFKVWLSKHTTAPPP